MKGDKTPNSLLQTLDPTHVYKHTLAHTGTHLHTQCTLRYTNYTYRNPKKEEEEKEKTKKHTTHGYVWEAGSWEGEGLGSRGWIHTNALPASHSLNCLSTLKL